MRIEQLYYFLEVAKGKSITLTSEKLHISQQTLSGTIKNLEDELGVALLNRNYNGISLTKEGDAFFATAKEMTTALETFQANYVAAKSRLTGTIHVYTTPVLSTTILGSILAKFMETHPFAKFQTYENDLKTVYRIFEQENLPANSIALINRPEESHLENDSKKFSPPDHTQFTPITQEHFVVCANKHSPLAQKNSLSIKTLLQQPLILHLTDDLEDSTLYYLLQQHGAPKIVFTTGNAYVYLQSIENNIGVGLLPNLSLSNPFIKNNIANLHLLSIKDNPLHSVIGYLLQIDKQHNPLLDAFTSFLKAYVV